ncbi:hypothetical protein SCP_1601760 [Sparassis crispa]|uniref:RanBD1 domain-containing protein n=1 Tax=Sparassis crispa TaxID=139825 RepID=A0A401H518_9APHY|nr:hypothetical protein SCP_1601760 [Sparassis crispa]GBE89514.1 hypothetical protein SCP_1601760 [Sparassis crispa]
MFPLNDFNLVCCALATVSAAFGYNVTRRRRSHSLNTQRLAEEERKREVLARSQSVASMFSSCDSTMTLDSEGTGSEPPVSVYPSPPESVNALDDTEPGTLKRKNRDEGNNDPDGETHGAAKDRSSSPPRKRCRTPPASYDPESTVKNEGEAAMTSTQTVNIITADQQQLETVPAVKVVVADGQQQEAFFSGETATQIKIEEPDIASQTPFSFPIPKPHSECKPSIFSSMQPIPAVKPSTAFKSFAGSSSSFTTTSTSSISPRSGFKPVWCSGSIILNAPSSTELTTSQDDAQAVCDAALSSGEGSSSLKASTHEDPLAAHLYSKSTHSTLTGEEDETIRAELKGAKVYVKRGGREFSDGILGHAKILVHKETGEERILFRREQVWKVTMSVRLRPTVRCTYDEEQGVLRIVLKELEEREGVPPDQWKQQVVIYALKRGKASKGDFAEFSRAVVASGQLCAQLPPDLRSAVV